MYDALHKRAANGNFAGLRVGDYIDVPLVSASGVAAQQSVRFLLAHFDPYYCCGDSSKGHHIAFVASAPIAVAKTVTGVANDSFLNVEHDQHEPGHRRPENAPTPTSNLKAWETAFEACLPESLTKYLLTQRVLLEERYSASGALNDSNSWSGQDIGKVFSLSEMEVYGCPVWGTKGYSVGFDCQFDLFRDTAHRLNGNRYSWWLRSVVGGSSSGVCCVISSGRAGCYSATYTWVRPAPASSSASQPSRPQGRKQSAERKEGATIGREPVNTHPARVAGRCLHGAALRGFAAFHGHTSSGCQSHIASRAGCPL